MIQNLFSWQWLIFSLLKHSHSDTFIVCNGQGCYLRQNNKQSIKIVFSQRCTWIVSLYCNWSADSNHLICKKACLGILEGHEEQVFLWYGLWLFIKDTCLMLSYLWWYHFCLRHMVASCRFFEGDVEYQTLPIQSFPRVKPACDEKCNPHQILHLFQLHGRWTGSSF